MFIRQSFRPDAEIRDAFVFKEISAYADASCLLTLGHTHILTTLSVQQKIKKAPVLKFPKGTEDTSFEDQSNVHLPSSMSFSLETFGSQNNFQTEHFQIGLEKVLCFLNNSTLLKNLHFEAKCLILNDDGNSFSAAAISLQYVFSETVKKYLHQSFTCDLPPIFAMSCGMFGRQLFLDLDAQEEQKADALGYFVFTHKGSLLFSYAYAQSNSFSAMEFVRLADISFHHSKQMKIWPLKLSKAMS
jgi:ribonuclease PH